MDIRKSYSGGIHWFDIALIFIFYLCIGGFFFLPDSQAHNFPTYILSLLVLVGIKKIYNELLGKIRELALIAVFLLYSSLSWLWSTDRSLHALISCAGNGLLIFTFILAVIYLCKTNSVAFRRLLQLVVWSASISASYSIYLHVQQFGIDMSWLRAGGWNEMLSNPVKAGLVYGFVFVYALVSCLTQKTSFARWSLLPAITILLVFVLLTFSRSAILAIAVSTISCMWLLRRREGTASMMVVPILVGVIAFCTILLAMFASPSPANYRSNLAGVSLASDQVLKSNWPGYDSVCDGQIDTAQQEGISIPASQGAVWSNFELGNHAIYFIYLKVKSSAAHDDGFFLRAYELDSQISKHNHLAKFRKVGSEMYTEATRQVSMNFESKPLPNKSKEYLIRYQPTPTADIAGITVLNWTHDCASQLVIEDLQIYKAVQSQIENKIRSFGSEYLNQMINRGISSRDTIWRQVMASTIRGNWLVGVGNESEFVNIYLSNYAKAQHAHSIYLSTFYLLGAIGLILLIAIIIRLNQSMQQISQFPTRVIVISLMVYGLTALSFDGGKIVEKIDFVWLLLWLPSAMILGAEEIKSEVSQDE